jgi:predicted ATPase/class 3 adenylate cyclase
VEGGSLKALFFSDIEGSTRLATALGSAWPEVLDRHREIVRAAIGAHDGEEQGTDGDGFFVVFDSADAAVAAAIAVQLGLEREPWPEGRRVRVRIGLHAGEVVRDREGYAGLTVHHAARIASAANGGQVVLSEQCRVLVSTWPTGTFLDDVGRHHLKDVDGRVHLFQLRHGDLQQRFPPLRTVEVARHNLPAVAGPLLGRDAALPAVVELIDGDRLVTLTGAGGCGKTRLAVESARAVAGARDATWFVELGSVSDPGAVSSRIVDVLGLVGDGRPALDLLAEAVGVDDVQLVLDNCEHVLDVVAELAEGLLRRCPNLRILATSREALGVSGETAWRVPSLPVPEDDDDDALASASVQLFVARAAAADPSFTPGNDERRHVFAICRRLDGIPLAIELAAARCAVVEVAELAERLEHSFRILTGASRSALPRQQTLDATIDWSYQLLGDDERDLLCRFAVFRGGASLEAVEAVAGDDTLDRLSALVGKSLIVRERAAGRARYRLLEPVRQFALARLSERGIGADARDRHLHHFVGFARDVLHAYEHAELDRAREAAILLELDNLVAAQEWSHTNRRDEDTCWIAVGIGHFVLFSRGFDVARRLGLAALEATDVAPGLRTLVLASNLIDVDTEADLRALFEEGEQIAPDEDHRARLRLSVGIPLVAVGGDVDEALRYVEEAGPTLRASGARGLVARHTIVHAFVLRRTGELERARELLEDVLETDGILSGLQTYARYLCGVVAETEGDDDRAVACYQAVIDEGQALAVGTSFSYTNLSSLLWERGEMDTALEHARTALRLERTRETVGNRNLPIALAHAAQLEHEAGDRTTAEALLAQAFELGRRFNTGYTLFFPFAVRALIRARAGDLDGARADRDQMAEWLQEHRHPAGDRLTRELDALLDEAAVGSPPQGERGPTP